MLDTDSIDGRMFGSRYVEYLAFTYAKTGLLSIMGTPLGPRSGGPIIGRTVFEWAYGWRDPLLEAAAPTRRPYWWSFDPLLQFKFRPTSEQARWADLAQAVANGTAPRGAAKRFQTWVMATGRDDDAALFRAGNVLADNGATSTPHPGGSLPVEGRFIAHPGFGNMAKLPFGLDTRLPASVYFGSATLGADPQLNIGLGRVLRMSWDGEPATPYLSVPSVRYVLTPDAIAPCANVSATAAAPHASLLAMTQATQACITGDYIAGVWNLSSSGIPLFLSLPHYLYADPAMAASLGPGASAMQPNASVHAFQVILETVFGIPMAGSVGFQTVIGLKPTPVLFPALYHGAPGPGGYTFIPTGWTAIKFKLDSHTVRLARLPRPRSPWHASPCSEGLIPPWHANAGAAAVHGVLCDGEQPQSSGGHNQLVRRPRRRICSLGAVSGPSQPERASAEQPPGWRQRQTGGRPTGRAGRSPPLRRPKLACGLRRVRQRQQPKRRGR